MFSSILSSIRHGAPLEEILLSTLFSAIAVVIALSIHEFSHAFAAYLCGDRTAKADGRMSLNPLNHIDPIGALCLFFIGFGWAKPVMINPANFRRRKAGYIITSLAGVFANFLLGFLSYVALSVVINFTPYGNSWVTDLLGVICGMNVGLCVFNLIPLPPLDGSRVVEALLPPRAAMTYARVGQYSRYILLGLILLDNFTGISILDYILNVPYGLIISFYNRGVEALWWLIWP